MSKKSQTTTNPRADDSDNSNPNKNKNKKAPAEPEKNDGVQPADAIKVATAPVSINPTALTGIYPHTTALFDTTPIDSRTFITTTTGLGAPDPSLQTQNLVNRTLSGAGLFNSSSQTAHLLNTSIHSSPVHTASLINYTLGTTGSLNSAAHTANVLNTNIHGTHALISSVHSASSLNSALRSTSSFNQPLHVANVLNTNIYGTETLIPSTHSASSINSALSSTGSFDPSRHTADFLNSSLHGAHVFNSTLSSTVASRIFPAISRGLTNNIALGQIPTSSLVNIIANDEVPSVKSQEWERETARLKQEVVSLAHALKKQALEKAASEEETQQFKKMVEDLTTRERLSFLLGRVHSKARSRLLESEDFQKEFLEAKTCNAFVISLDIRRSTELMLKARTPEKFSSFITTLCSTLIDIIVDSFGIFDKFTGDGVLAFFPDFYSGEDAAYNVISAAQRSHAAFEEHYRNCRQSFSPVLLNIGLGIGIDYGNVHLVQVADGWTVVGEPVVYACRLSAAPAGVTLLNQPAYEEIIDKAETYCYANETSLEIKHEGSLLVYEAGLKEKMLSPKSPPWMTSDA